MIQELSASVGRAPQEIVEAFVILHEIWLDEFAGAVIDHLQVTAG